MIDDFFPLGVPTNRLAADPNEIPAWVKPELRARILAARKDREPMRYTPPCALEAEAASVKAAMTALIDYALRGLGPVTLEETTAIIKAKEKSAVESFTALNGGPKSFATGGVVTIRAFGTIAEEPKAGRGFTQVTGRARYAAPLVRRVGWWQTSPNYMRYWDGETFSFPREIDDYGACLSAATVESTCSVPRVENMVHQYENFIGE